MLSRFFIPFVATAFLINSFQPSYCAEEIADSDIPKFQSGEEAINYWSIHCNDLKDKINVVRERCSTFTFSYEDLKKRGFDVFMTKDYRNMVFSNITVRSIGENNKELASNICAILSHPQCYIKSLQIIGSYFTLKYGKICSLSESSNFDTVGSFPWWGDFGKALSENNSLEKLNLRGNYFTQSAFNSILGGLTRLQNLKEIDFSSCKLLDENRPAPTSGYYYVDSGGPFVKLVESVHKIPSLKTVMLNNLNVNSTGLQRLIGNLKDSSITKLGLQGIAITPEIGEDIIKLLEGGKTFEELDLVGCRWEGFGLVKFASYEMAKRIGMAVMGKVDRFGLDSSCGDSHSPYDIDYRHYNPTWAFIGDAARTTVGVTLIGGYAFIFLGALAGKWTIRF